MAKNKIIYGNETLIDLTEDTVSPENLLSGVTAHDRSGESIQGTFDPSGYLPITGGTIKPLSGNGEIRVEGADNATNYGSIKLVRNSQTVTIVPSEGLASPRIINLPNLNGTVVLGSDNYGKSVTGTSSETLKALFHRLRTTYFEATMRRNIIRISSLDGISNLIFSCQRYASNNVSAWACVMYDSSPTYVIYSVTFDSSSADIKKVPAGGMVQYDLSNNSANNVTLTIL